LLQLIYLQFKVSVCGSCRLKPDFSDEGSVQLIDAPNLIFTVYHFCIKNLCNTKFVAEIKYNLKHPGQLAFCYDEIARGILPKLVSCNHA